MNHVGLYSCWLALAASLVGGCMVEVESRGHGAATIDSHHQALDLQAPSFDPEPPQTEVPGCWWVDDPADCDVKPECVPKAPSDGGRTPGSRTIAARSDAPLRATSTLSGAPSRSPAGSSGPSRGLDLKAAEPCPTPNGVTACSTCARVYGNPWRARLELSLSSRVLVTNGLNNSSFMVKDYPVLNAQALGEGGAIPPIEVDLTQGTTTMQSGSVNFSEDLYMFFTSDFETGPYPIGNWVFCPKNGQTCVQISD